MATKPQDIDDNGNVIKLSETQDIARKAAFEQMRKKALLVNLTCKQIANLPFDIKTSNAVAKTMAVTDPSMIQVRKVLFNPQHLSRIRSLINDAMIMVWNYTRPWDNIGYRLLPMEYYDDFNETFGKIKDEFEESVKVFISNYDDYLAESKGLLGDCFNLNDYPDKAQLPQFFQLEINTNMLPEIDDVRLNISGPELVDMQNQITAKYQGALAESIDNLIATFDQTKDQALMTIIKTIETLNIKGDPAVEMRVAELKDKQELNDKPLENAMVIDDFDELGELSEYDNLI